VFVTKMMPRGTIPTLVPDELARKVPANIERMALGATYYELEPAAEALGATTKPGFKGDPIKGYGQKAAAWIMGTIDELDTKEDRKIALRALLDEVDPKLWNSVSAKADMYKKRLGMQPKAALQRALAAAMSDGMLREIVEAGKSGHIKDQTALALGYYEAMGAWYNPVDWAKKAGSAVKKGAEAVYGAGKAAVTAPVKAASWAAKKGYSGAKWVGGKIKSGAGKVVDWVGTGLKKLGELACGVASSSLGPAAGAAGAAAMGAPPQVGAMGVQVASGLCTKEEAAAAAAQQQAAAGKLPGWVLPAAIGGGALVLVLALRK
jgi:hypothetical protein